MGNILRWLIGVLLTLLAHIDVKGYEYLPKEGSCVVATNHLGMLDVPIGLYALNRWDIFVMVGEKWEKVGFFRWAGKYLNIIFIDRFNPDVKTLRKVISLMEENKILVIAPEGTRSRSGVMIEAKAGVSYLAAKLNRPIVPVGITGTEDKVLRANLKKLRRGHITVTAGPAFTLPPLPRENRDEALKQYTDEIMCHIAALLPEKYRGAYADHPRLKELESTGAAIPGGDHQ
jgi:1-acyl-sn-glycerol-3-phosphate acyltransferase